MKMWKWLVGLAIILYALLAPYSAQADTSAYVHITATGIIIAPPAGFTVTYVNDFETHLSWTNAPNSISTMVRAAYGHEPTSMTDGYLVYQGAGDSFNDTAASLTSPDVLYYRAWAQRNDGIWGTIYAETDTEDIMSLSFLYIGIIILILIAVGMAVATFFTRRKVLGVLSGLLFTAIVGGVLATPNFPMANLIILFSAVMSIAMFTSPMYLTMEEAAAPPVVESQHDRISRRIEARRHKYDSFRPKVKEPYL